jgi:hypothetical protein
MLSVLVLRVAVFHLLIRAYVMADSTKHVNGRVSLVI